MNVRSVGQAAVHAHASSLPKGAAEMRDVVKGGLWTGYLGPKAGEHFLKTAKPTATNVGNDKGGTLKLGYACKTPADAQAYAKELNKSWDGLYENFNEALDGVDMKDLKIRAQGNQLVVECKWHALQPERVPAGAKEVEQVARAGVKDGDLTDAQRKLLTGPAVLRDGDAHHGRITLTYVVPPGQAGSLARAMAQSRNGYIENFNECLDKAEVTDVHVHKAGAAVELVVDWKAAK